MADERATQIDVVEARVTQIRTEQIGACKGHVPEMASPQNRLCEARFRKVDAREARFLEFCPSHVDAAPAASNHPKVRERGSRKPRRFGVASFQIRPVEAGFAKERP